MKQPHAIEKDEPKDAKPSVAEKPVAKPDAPKYQPLSKDDHVAHIADLARGLSTTSPSGAETIGEKILEHCGAIQDPKTYDERKAKEFKAEQELDAQRAKERAELKTRPEVVKPA